jgi:hypothetical protein
MSSNKQDIDSLKLNLSHLLVDVQRIRFDLAQVLENDGRLERLDYIAMMLRGIIDKLIPTVRPPCFYPLVGTVFIDTLVKPHRPLFVENKNLLADQKDNWVCFYDREEGLGDYPRWLDDVKSDILKVIWCPEAGSIKENEDYFTYWGL